MSRHVQMSRRSRMVFAALGAGCLALLPAASAVAAPSDPTDPLGPTIAQIEYQIALLQYDVCMVTEAVNGQGFCIPPTPPS